MIGLVVMVVLLLLIAIGAVLVRRRYHRHLRNHARQ